MAIEHVDLTLVGAVAVIIGSANSHITTMQSNTGTEVVTGIAFMGGFIRGQSAISGQASNQVQPRASAFIDPGRTLVSNGITLTIDTIIIGRANNRSKNIHIRVVINCY